MKEYTISTNVFGLSTAQNEIFEISTDVASLDELREKIEIMHKNKDKDCDFEENDFPLKIVTINIDWNDVYYEESAIFN